MPPARTHFCDVAAREEGGFSAPVKTFLNCTMPALVNIKVGSLRGTSGDDGTTLVAVALAKIVEKAERMSLTLVMAMPCSAAASASSERWRCARRRSSDQVLAAVIASLSRRRKASRRA